MHSMESCVKLAIVLFGLSLVACGSLEEKSIQVTAGDSKARVTEIMGVPDDRQMRGTSEAWQYCQTGAGFGYHDYRVIWFTDGAVTGVTSYKSRTPARGCIASIRQVEWEDAPDATIEIRNR